MFSDLDGCGDQTITLQIDGVSHQVRARLTVAAALLCAGVTRFKRAPHDHSPRGPHCMMGVCFECLCVIDGEANRQACTTVVRDGMTVETQQGAPDLDPFHRVKEGAA